MLSPLPRLTLLSLSLLVNAVASPLTSRETNQPVPASATWNNPLVRQRADPWVCRAEDGRYLFTGTVPEYDRIELSRADTLGDLGAAKPVVIWRKPASGPASHHIWAPELHHIDGKWYVYFAAGRADDIWAIRIYVLECAAADPLAGPWVEKGRLTTHLDTFSLDATTFSHHGVRYLVWAQHDPAIGGNTSLFLAPSPTLGPSAARPCVCPSPTCRGKPSAFA